MLFYAIFADDDGNNTWPEVLKFLFDCAGSANPGLKEAALIIFSSVPGIFGIAQQQHLDMIKQLLSSSLSDTANLNVRYEFNSFSFFLKYYCKFFENFCQFLNIDFKRLLFKVFTLPDFFISV